MAHTAPPADMGNLIAESKRLINSSLSQNTYKAYRAALNKFQSFLNIYGLQPTWPLHSNILLYFIAYLSIQKMSPNSVSLYISALSYFHKIKHLPDPTKSFLINKALQGLKRNNRVVPDNRLPITLPILEKLVVSLQSVCCSTYEVKLFTCAFSLAYFALLRVGEFTSVNSNTQNSSHCIQLKHIQAHPHKHYLRLTIPHSKTDQVGKTTTFIIHSQPLAPLCPVKATLDFIECRPHTPVHHSFLIHLNTKPLTRYQFNSVLQKAIENILPTPGHFGTHSFRIGRATDLALQGTSDSEIQKFGRWKSVAFLKYIRII